MRYISANNRSKVFILYAPIYNVHSSAYIILLPWRSFGKTDYYKTTKKFYKIAKKVRKCEKFKNKNEFPDMK